MQFALKKMALALGMTLIPAPLMAQQTFHGVEDAQEVDFSLTYVAQHSTTTAGNSFWLQGGGAEISATFYHGLGLAADVTGTHASNIESTGVGLTLVTAAFGPRYTWTLKRRNASPQRVKLFGEALVGIANGVDSVFPSATGAQSDANSLALQTGGGADLVLARHLALRLIQANWLRTQIPNANSNVQNNLQLGAGIVFRIPH